MNTRILHISDTHTMHEQLKIPENIDIIIHSGDCSNIRDSYLNEKEVRDFITWYSKIPVKYKIYVAGNHDTSIERGLVTKDNFQQAGIVYLENETITIEGNEGYIKVFGTPYTPTYGNWSFMKKRGRLSPIYDLIEENTNIIVTHGPPYGILDLSYNREGILEFCGCKELRNKLNKIKSRYSLFGHIHNFQDIVNQGIRISEGITYSNATCVEDGKFDYGLISQGNIIEI